MKAIEDSRYVFAHVEY